MIYIHIHRAALGSRNTDKNQNDFHDFLTTCVCYIYLPDRQWYEHRRRRFLVDPVVQSVELYSMPCESDAIQETGRYIEPTHRVQYDEDPYLSLFVIRDQRWKRWWLCSQGYGRWLWRIYLHHLYVGLNRRSLGSSMNMLSAGSRSGFLGFLTSVAVPGPRDVARARLERLCNLRAGLYG